MQKVLSAMALLFISGTTTMAAPNWAVVTHRLCVPDFEFIPRKIPIGCPIVDPLLGCDPRAKLSLKVQLEAPGGIEGRLEFSGLSDAELHGLKTRGSATAGGSTVRLRAGESQILGLDAARQPAPLMLTSLDASDELIRELRSRELSSRDRTDLAKATLRIQQLVGEVPVSETVIVYEFVQCPPTPPPQPGAGEDTIRLTQNASGRHGIALIDGKRASCMVDEWDFGPSDILLGNMVPAGGCGHDSRATIFTRTYAVDFVVNTTEDPNAIVWTGVAGEVLPRTAKPLVTQPVKVWMLRNYACPNPSDCMDRAQAMMAYAKDLFPHAYAGISFLFAGPIDLWGNSSPTVVDARENANCTTHAFANATIGRLDAVKTLTDAPGEPNAGKRLEVFFVNSAGGVAGHWCGHTLDGPRPASADSILIATTAADNILAHEFGHALMDSGLHTGDSGDSRFNLHSNLMKDGALGSYLTIGQLFRASLHKNGSVNRHRARVGSTVDCLEFADNSLCPRASCDVERETDPPVFPLGEQICAP
jgi:hypothetical protein